MNDNDRMLILANQILGEFIGTLHGICAWDIPPELREKLREHIKDLQKRTIGPTDYGKDVHGS